MNTETGEIRSCDKIPPEDRDKWSKPFKVGDVVLVLGVRMKIIKIKQMRQEIHLQFAGPVKEDEPCTGCPHFVADDDCDYNEETDGPAPENCPR